MGKTNKDTLIKCSSKFKKTIKELYNSKDFLDDLVNTFESFTNDFVDKEYNFQNILFKRSKKKIFQEYEQDFIHSSVNSKSFEGKSDKEKELLLKEIYNDYKHNLEISLEGIKGDVESKAIIRLYLGELNKSTKKASAKEIRDSVAELFSERSIENLSNPNYFKDKINRHSYTILGDHKILFVICYCKYYIDIGNSYAKGNFSDNKIFLGRNKEEWLELAKQCKENLKGISEALINTTPKRGSPKKKIYPIHALKKEYNELKALIEKHLVKNFKDYIFERKVGTNKTITIKDSSNLLEIIKSINNELNGKYEIKEEYIIDQIRKRDEFKQKIKSYKEKKPVCKALRLNTPDNLAKHILAEHNSITFNDIEYLLTRKSTFN